MTVLEKMRVVGTCCEIGGYFIQLHVNTVLGVFIFMMAQILFLPYFIKTKAYDYVALLSIMSIISLTKLLTGSPYYA